MATVCVKLAQNGLYEVKVAYNAISDTAHMHAVCASQNNSYNHSLHITEPVCNRFLNSL